MSNRIIKRELVECKCNFCKVTGDSVRYDLRFEEFICTDCYATENERYKQENKSGDEEFPLYT